MCMLFFSHEMQHITAQACKKSYHKVLLIHGAMVFGFTQIWTNYYIDNAVIISYYFKVLLSEELVLFFKLHILKLSKI